MIGAIAKLAMHLGIPARAARAVAWVLVVLAIAGAAAVTIARIYGSGHQAGADQVRVDAAEKRDQAVTETRADERSAGDIARAIDARTARADALTDAQLESTIEEIRNALDAVPPAADDADLPAAPVDGMRDTINAATDRANRSAGAADALR